MKSTEANNNGERKVWILTYPRYIRGCPCLIPHYFHCWFKSLHIKILLLIKLAVLKVYLTCEINFDHSAHIRIDLIHPSEPGVLVDGHT